MTRSLILAAAAALALVGPPAATAQTAITLDPLRATLSSALRTHGVSTDDLSRMPLWKMATIKSILDSEGSEGQKAHRIRAVLARVD